MSSWAFFKLSSDFRILNRNDITGGRTAPVPLLILLQIFAGIGLVRPERESSNSRSTQITELFETLSDWEEQLKHLDISFDALEDNSCDAVSSNMEGPQP